MLIQRFALVIALMLTLATAALADPTRLLSETAAQSHCDAAKKVNDEPAIVVYCLKVAEESFMSASQAGYLSTDHLHLALAGLYKEEAAQNLLIVAHFENRLKIGTPREHLREAYNTATEVSEDKNTDPHNVTVMLTLLRYIRSEMKVVGMRTP